MGESVLCVLKDGRKTEIETEKTDYKNVPMKKYISVEPIYDKILRKGNRI